MHGHNEFVRSVKDTHHGTRRAHIEAKYPSCTSPKLPGPGGHQSMGGYSLTGTLAPTLYRSVHTISTRLHTLCAGRLREVPYAPRRGLRPNGNLHLLSYTQNYYTIVPVNNQYQLESFLFYLLQVPV